MADHLTVVGTCIVQALSSDAQAVGLIGNKTYQVLAPHNAVVPYVTFQHLSGGKDNESKNGGFDARWIITGVAKTQTQARLIASLINEVFDEKYLPLIDGYTMFAPVTEQEPIIQSEDVQMEQYWRAGAVYRFRAARNQG